MHKILLISIFVLHSCDEKKSLAQTDCHEYHTYKNETDFFNSKNGRVGHVVLAIKNHNTQKLQSLKLQMNNKPQTRVQRLILEDEQTLPEDWRNLAGLNPLEVLDYFTKHHTVLSKQLVFQEFPGVVFLYVYRYRLLP